MDVLDAIQKMIDDSGQSASALAKHLDRSRQSVYNMFRTKSDVKVDTLANMADFMGYKLVLQSKKDEIVITPRSKDKKKAPK